jgi:formylglycine-generating enzyme required for sulfatase activity
MGLAGQGHRGRLPQAIGIAACLVGWIGCGGGTSSVHSGKSAKPKDLASMVRIPAGEFLMGRDDGDPDEAPQHHVYLDEYYIDRTEVTNAAFKAYCDANRLLYPNNPDWDVDYFLQRGTSPVINLTWEQARSYCAWTGKRLPTEAEWEKAARGADGRLYPWGNAWMDSTANIYGEPFAKAAPVGSLPRGASPYGVLDMAGNVWEWCADWYLKDEYTESAPPKGGPTRNPQGPAGPTPWRVVRGGGYTSPKTDAETANRSKNPPTQMIHHLGCRCAWSK